MSAPLHVSKLDAARRQLETAITLFFHFGDPISIHALAAAACEVLGDLADSYQIKYELTFETAIKTYVKPEHHARLIEKHRAPKNFFKHADRDPGAMLKFNPTITEFFLFEAVDLYHLIANEWPPLFLTYRAWWVLQNQDGLLEWPPEAKEALQQIEYGPEQRELFFSEILPALTARQAATQLR